GCGRHATPTTAAPSVSPCRWSALRRRSRRRLGRGARSARRAGHHQATIALDSPPPLQPLLNAETDQFELLECEDRVLHPAVSRARRCALAHEFDRPPANDAKAWLSPYGASAMVTRPTRIADLHHPRPARAIGCRCRARVRETLTPKDEAGVTSAGVTSSRQASGRRSPRRNGRWRAVPSSRPPRPRAAPEASH